MHSEYEAPLILFYNHELCSQFCNNILQSVMDNLNTMSLSKKQMTIHMLRDYKKYLDNDFDMFTNIVRSQKEIIGHHFTNDFKNRYFCGFYNPVELGDFVFNHSRNLMLYKLEMIKHIMKVLLSPLKLKTLYEYIENNYSDDEFVVTLFGDHGQAYIVPPNDHHLSRGLSNICFMTRGGGFSGTSDEYISITDYTNIITKLSGITNAEINSDGILPKTFGGIKEHEFVITETLHPGDPYMIALHNPEYTFFLTTETNVTQYGKADLTSYSTMLIDSSGKKITNTDLENKFINYILEYTKYIQIY